MNQTHCSFSEVSCYQFDYTLKREISLDIGANQSTTQDFKLAESGGYYCYKESGILSSIACNRFIHWRTNLDYVEFCESSVDFNLSDGNVKLRFRNTPILDGISVHEVNDQVIILLATVASVHRLVLPHPKKLNAAVVDSSKAINSQSKNALTLNSMDLLTRLSIFHVISSETLRDPTSYCVLCNAFISGSSTFGSPDIPFPITSSSWLDSNGQANFALADYSGNLSLVIMDSSTSERKVLLLDLKQTTIMDKLWHNFVPSIISRSSKENVQAVTSIIHHRNPLSNGYLVFALCRDLHIRVWCPERQECLLSQSLGHESQEKSSDVSQNINFITIRRPILKKAECPYPQNNLYLASFVANEYVKKFFIHKLISNSDQLQLILVACIVSSEDDLIDFVFTPNTLWALWLNSESDTCISHCQIQGNQNKWQRISLHSTFVNTLNVKSLFANPRELFIEDIFKKNRFSLQTISKAISTLNRTPESTYFGHNINSLMNEATTVVENRMRLHSGSSELTADEYTNLEIKFWGEFHSYCVQYHNVGNKPLGLILDLKTGLIGVLRVSCVSFIRPNDAIDHMILSNNYSPPYSLSNIIFEDTSLEPSILVLLESVKLISHCLTEDSILEFEMGLLEGELAQQVALYIVDNYLINASNTIVQPQEPLKNSLQKIFTRAPRLLEAIDLILKSLNLEWKESFEDEMDPTSAFQFQVLDQVYSSNLGACFLSESLKQISRLRFEFSRDLLLFQTLILRLDDKSSLQKLETVRSNSISLNGIYLQAYYFMTWVCETCINQESTSSQVIENTVTLLSLLELHEYINVNRNEPMNSSIINDFMPKSIAAHLILHKKCSLARKILATKVNCIEDINNCQLWTSVLPLFLQSIAQLIWPISKSFHLPQFLLGFGQFDLLINYSKLLDAWSQYNIYSRRFVKAIVYLYLGEPRKSIVLFNQAFYGITEEAFMQRIFQSPFLDCEKKLTAFESGSLVISYYNRIIQLCKIRSHPDIIVELAENALNLLDESDPSFENHYSSLASTIFACQLELGNTLEAYQSMILNPYHVQKKDCLRQFINYLYEKASISEMISYDFRDMEEDFINIIEFKARSSDLLNVSNRVDYYEILYAYFVNANNFRKSASVIYEYARRLGQELSGLESLKKQSKCLVLAINSLRLIESKYAWIIKPTLKSMNYFSLSPKLSNTVNEGKRKFNEDSSSTSSDSPNKREIQVLNIEDIIKEYELVNVRFKLLEKSPELNAIASTPLTSDIAVTLLIGNLMFDSAFHLSCLLKLPLEPVFEGLVSKYIYLTELPSTKSNLEANLMEINECFTENDTASLSYIANAEITPIEKMLALILEYIKLYEEVNQSRYHRCVAEKLLSNGIFLPSSLKLSYQKRNCPELLYLLMAYNYIEECVNLGIEFIDGYLGKGTEYFNIESSVMNAKSPIYFPHQHFKCLLKILDIEKEQNHEYKKFSAMIGKKLKEYQQLIITCSRMTISVN